ncbi:MAG: NADH-quinone oxidoreductase subunit N [Acidobacteriota bacterium]
MSPSYAVSTADLWSIAPEIWLAGAGALLLLLDAFLPALKRAFTPLSLVATLGAGWLAWTSVPTGPSFHGTLDANAITCALTLIVLLAASLALLASDGYLRREGLLSGEYHALLLWSSAGMTLMLRANELLTVFIALELLSICLYALAGYHRRIAVAAEAAIKYFLMGAFVSAFVLLGIALLYGETGSSRIPEIARALAEGKGSLALEALGVVLLIAGFGFKMSLVPFHAWSPDTYQGAPTPFVAFLSVAPKAASVAVLIKIVAAASASAPLAPKWSTVVSLLAVLSMLGGNLLALVQRDLKRMLAYSGVAHMGYLLIPLASLNRDSWVSVLVYLFAYALMNAGAFAVATLLFDKPGEQHLISDLSGWGYRFPVKSACLAICMLSLGGIPPTLGFLGKYLVFLHAVENHQIWLAAVGVLASLVGVFYYLRVVYVLYMKDEVKAPVAKAGDFLGNLSAGLAALLTLVLGLWPGPVLGWVADAVARLG